LLRSFPLGGNRQPHLNQTLVPGLDVLPVWQRTRGAGVTVAVIDTGVDSSNADLAPNLLEGWNFHDGNRDTTDGAGHGTVIASVIAAAAGNGGFVGIAPDAKILPIKVMGGPDGSGWSDQAVVQGIEYALQRGAKVLNLSLGGLDAPIPGIAGALADARRAGALVVIAAGNDGANLDAGAHTEFPDGYGLPNTLTPHSNRTDARDLEAIGGSWPAHSWPAHMEPPVFLPHPHGSPTLVSPGQRTRRAQWLPDSLPAVGNREQGEESWYDDTEAASRRGDAS
jgi:subtilisin family serine protease